MPNRKLAKAELDFIEESEFFNKALQVTLLLSLDQHGINTDGRGMRAMKIFTRQTLSALSLDKLLPKPNIYTKALNDLWDVVSIASITRNIVEGYLALYYFGTQKVSKSEAELRFFILQLHRNIEWYNLRRNELNEIEREQFEKGIPEEKERIRNHAFFGSLTKEQQNKASRGFEMYKSKSDFEQDLPICKNLQLHYRLLSNLVHPVPLSIERTDNERGRGLANEMDVLYCLQCLMLARKYLAGSTVSIAEHFSQLRDKFSKEVEVIRPLQFVGFH